MEFITVKEGDTLQSVADQLYAKLDDLLESPLNKLDLTDPRLNLTATSSVPAANGKR